MLIELTILNRLPVGSFEEGGAIGRVIKTVISYEEGKVLGFVVKKTGIFSQDKIATLEDIVSIDNGGVVIRSVDSLVDSQEIVRVSKILKLKFNLIGLRTQTKDGKYLGKVSDALIDCDSGQIMRLYVKKLFSSYVFEHSQIIEITLKKVVLKADRTQKAKKTVGSLARAEIA